MEIISMTPESENQSLGIRLGTTAHKGWESSVPYTASLVPAPDKKTEQCTGFIYTGIAICFVSDCPSVTGVWHISVSAFLRIIQVDSDRLGNAKIEGRETCF